MHAKQVTGVVDQAIAKYAPAIRKRELPTSCLVRLVCDASTSAEGHGRKMLSPESDEAPADNVFRKKGQAWEVRFVGGEAKILLASKGAAYLHMLLSQPRKPISAIEMACHVAQNRVAYLLGSAGDKIDQDAITAYKARYADLKKELDNAQVKPR